MAETTLTIGLEGQVSLEDFTKAMTHFQSLVKALCEYLDREAFIRWELSALQAGNTTTTITGTSLDRELLAQVTNAFVTIGQHMQRGQTIPYPHAIAHPATQLTHIINDAVTAVRFAAAGTEVTIAERVPSPGQKDRRVSYGEVRGTVETLQRRQRRFTLYDEIFDEAIVCHLRADQQEMMRDFWEKLVVVTGEIHSDAATGHIIEVRVVDDIQELSAVPPGSYEQARGILDFGTERPETLLRKLRNAE